LQKLLFCGMITTLEEKGSTKGKATPDFDAVRPRSSFLFCHGNARYLLRSPLPLLDGQQVVFPFCYQAQDRYRTAPGGRMKKKKETPL